MMCGSITILNYWPRLLVWAAPERGRAKPPARFRLHLTGRRKRALHQIGERVDKARRSPERWGAQIEWRAALRGELRILNVEFDQRFDVLGYEGDWGNDDA